MVAPLKFRNGQVISSHTLWWTWHISMLGLTLIHVSKGSFSTTSLHRAPSLPNNAGQFLPTTIFNTLRISYSILISWLPSYYNRRLYLIRNAPVAILVISHIYLAGWSPKNKWFFLHDICFSDCLTTTWSVVWGQLLKQFIPKISSGYSL